jgi:hypothetical protein
MTDQAILIRYGFTPTQAANAMRKAPAKRTATEQALVRELVEAANV